MEIINVDDSDDSENENEAFPSERISDIRGPRKSDYKVSTPAIKESEQNSFNYCGKRIPNIFFHTLHNTYPAVMRG